MELWADGRRHAVPGPRQQRLLAVLLLSPGRVLTPDALVDALWDGGPPPTGRRQVHNAVAALRRSVAPLRDLVVRRGTGYLAMVAEEQIDCHRFTHAVESARRQRERGLRRDAIRTLTSALGLWRGPAFAGLSGQVFDAAAARLHEERLAAVEGLADLRLAEGEGAGLVAELKGLCAEHPLHEGFARQLMIALCRAERQQEALAAYDRIRRALADELGLDPGPALRTAHQQVLRGAPETVLTVPLANRPEPPQPTADGWPAPAEAAPTPQPHAAPYLLPHDLADFTGRLDEISQVVAMVDGAPATAVSVVTLDGMAGVGKTTLAVRVAHLIGDRYPDGRFFVDLRGHTPGQRALTPAATLELFLLHLGTPPELIPQDYEARVGAWRSALAGRRVLLVLDNAASEAQIRPLLPGAPGSVVLITSRRRLAALEGAQSLSLDPLPHNDAVDLFTRVVGPGRAAREPALVGEVVRLCGLLPLTIRIAASRLRHRPAWRVADLAYRLRDERRRIHELSLGDRSALAAFHVSYQQLPDDQRGLFRLLSLIPGPDFGHHDAAALLDLPLARSEDLLEALLDAHLLTQRSAGRYHLHDLVLHYARSLLERHESASDQRRAFQRLTEHYLRLGHAIEHLVDPGRHLVALDSAAPSTLPTLRTVADARSTVAIGHRTFLPVIGQARERGLLREAWQLSLVLSSCLLRQGYVDEALTGYELGLEAARSADDAEAQAVVLRSLGFAHISIGRLADALTTLRDGLAIERRRGNAPGVGRFLNNIGVAHIRMGQYADAIAALSEVTDLLGDDRSERDRAITLGNLGVAHTQLGRYEEAHEHFNQMLGLSERSDNRSTAALALINLGWVHTKIGELDTAMDYLNRGLTLNREIGSMEGEGRGRYMLADCLLARGNPAEAMRHSRDALSLARKINNQDIESHAQNVLGRAHLALGELEEAARCFESVLHISERSGQTFKAATAHSGLARIATLRGAQEEAINHWERGLAAALASKLPEADDIRLQLSRARND
nr:BTAD domain-containing putative transcriptional regulator [Streptomyces sp. 8K308]